MVGANRCTVRGVCTFSVKCCRLPLPLLSLMYIVLRMSYSELCTREDGNSHGAGPSRDSERPRSLHKNAERCLLSFPQLNAIFV